MSTISKTPRASGALTSLGALLGLGAVAAGSCCALPLGFAAIGLGGSWLGRLALLAPYRLYIVAGAGLCLGAGWFAALRRRAVCAADARAGTCRGAPPRRAAYVALTAATMLFVAGAAWPWIEPRLLAALAG